jgi:hypothetical protein
MVWRKWALGTGVGGGEAADRCLGTDREGGEGPTWTVQLAEREHCGDKWSIDVYSTYFVSLVWENVRCVSFRDLEIIGHRSEFASNVWHLSSLLCNTVLVSTVQMTESWRSAWGTDIICTRCLDILCARCGDVLCARYIRKTLPQYSMSPAYSMSVSVCATSIIFWQTLNT